jgi:molybdopterin-guanine dinucleotide biosynthesis protein A
MASAPTGGLILAGGRSSRMGGRDKALLTLAGKTLLTHAVSRLAPQVDFVAVNSSAPPEALAEYGLPVLVDRIPGHVGPLAGIHAGLSSWPAARLATVAVDLPFLPPDWVARLEAQLGDRLCTYASDGHRHALALLWAPGGAATVERYLERGGRSLHEFLNDHGAPVLFDRPGDRGLFLNINTPEDLARAEREWSRA